MSPRAPWTCSHRRAGKLPTAGQASRCTSFCGARVSSLDRRRPFRGAGVVAVEVCNVSSSTGVLGWLPGKRAATQRTTSARRKALAGLEFALAELDHDLRRLAELSHTAQDDAVAIATEASVRSRILAALQRGDSFAASLSDDEAASAWRALAASTTETRLLGRDPRNAAKLKVAAAQCEQLQQFVDQELTGS